MNTRICILLLFLTSCNYSVTHTPGGSSNGASQVQCINPDDPSNVTIPTYADVKATVFVPKCLRCHSAAASAGGVNLETYAAAKVMASIIEFDVVNNIMPKAPSPPLSQQEKDLVVTWVQAGAPESIDALPICNNSIAEPPAPVNPEPTNPPQDSIPIAEPDLPDNNCTEGMAPGYEEIKIKIFAPKCIGCHSAAASVGGVNLEAYATAKALASMIEFDVVNNIMPKAPNPPLSQQEKDLVVAWVQAGAPEVSCQDNGAEPVPSEPINDGLLTEMPPDSEISFELVKNRIFKFRCFSCHAGAGSAVYKLDLENYKEVKKELKDVLEEISEGEMPPPPRPSVTPIEFQVLRKWKKLGAPR